MAFGKEKQTETKAEVEDPEAETQDVPTAEVVEEEDPLLALTRDRHVCFALAALASDVPLCSF